MNKEYEIIFIPNEGRAILNNKTKKIYYSEFEIIEEKDQQITQLTNNWNELEEYILNHYIVGHTIQNASLDAILNKMKEIKERKQ